MVYKRETMSDCDRRLLEANKTLINKQTELKKDIRTLISYIKGRTYLENEVKTIIEYYNTNLAPSKYDRA